jgi:hypothetical protein
MRVNMGLAYSDILVYLKVANPLHIAFVWIIFFCYYIYMVMYNLNADKQQILSYHDISSSHAS